MRETGDEVREVEKELRDYMQTEDSVPDLCAHRLSKVHTILHDIAGAMDEKSEQTITLGMTEAVNAHNGLCIARSETMLCNERTLREGTNPEPVGYVDLVSDGKALRRVLKRLRKSEKLQGKALDAVEGMFEGIDVRTAELDRELDPLEHKDRPAYSAGYWSAAVGTMRSDLAELIELLGGKVEDDDG